MKKTLYLLFCVAAIATFSSCKKTIDTLSPSAEAIMGGNSVIVNSTLQLRDTVPGGFWMSSDSSIATVSSAGLVTGIKSGSTLISYVVNSSTYNFVVSDSVTVNPIVTALPITGGSSVSVGNTLTLSDAISGGTWSSSDSTIASITPDGIVTGVALGAVTISYTVNNAYANYTVTEQLTVTQ